MALNSTIIAVKDVHGFYHDKEVYFREKVTGRYDHPDGTSATERFTKRVKGLLVRKRAAPHEKPWSWRMGYNHCAGMYTGGHKVPLFGGSSLNRKPVQLNLFIDGKYLSPDLSGLPARTRDSIVLAIKAAKKLRRSGLPIPDAIGNFLVVQDQDNERAFRLWLSESESKPVVGMGLPIHMLSARSRGKIKDKSTAFFRASAGDRIFCTLTFIAPLDDKTGVSILNKFLTALRKEYRNLQYLWVAERQENGNIHFHVILNKRLPVRRWNALWVLMQYNEGLRGKNKFDETVTMEEVLNRFKDGTMQKVFNPMDVKKVKSIGGLSAYLTKYITKQKRGIPFGCAVWHCSRKVSRLFTTATVGPSAFAYMMGLNNARVDKSTGECFMPQVAKPKNAGASFCTIVYVNNKSAPLRYLNEMEQINKWLLSGEVQLDRNDLSEIGFDLYRQKLCKN